jgi:outer membrane immunogenic protein
VKRLFFRGVAFLALAAGGTAFAADIPLKAPAPLYSWSGCYIGGNVGYGGSLDDSISFTGAAQAAFYSSNQFPTSIPVNPKGVVGGGQVGCNAQFQQWVFGVETDLQASEMKVSDTLSPLPLAGTQFATAGTENRKWFGTLRPRIGLLVTPFALLYATGGLAYGDTEVGFNIQPVATPAATCALSGTCIAATASGTSVGWTAGAGLEWMFARNWSVKAEYLFVDLGSRQVTGMTLPNATPPGSYTAAAEFREHVARVGVNYKFDWGQALGRY